MKGGVILTEYKYIVWDWNGTLLDDVSAALSSVNDMLISRDMPVIDIKRYKECISVPISGFYEKVFDLEHEDYNEILRQYNDGYMRHLCECSLSDGVTDALEKFRKCGCRQIIVSSSNNDQLKANVKKYNVDAYFDAVLGSEDFFASSKIQRAVDYINKNGSGKILVIGDLVHDAEMAQKLNADCVLLTTGHENPDLLKKSGIRLINSLKDLFE